MKEGRRWGRIFDVAQVLHQGFGQGEIQFPEALDEWIETGELGRMVREASAGVQPTRRGPPLLYLLAYSYCRGIYGSEDVIRNLSEARFDEVVDEYGPEVQEVRHYRRSHRRELEGCLSRVLQQVWQRHFGSSPVVEPDEKNQTADGFNLHQDEHLFESEAKARIDRAAQYDCWACDW